MTSIYSLIWEKTILRCTASRLFCLLFCTSVLGVSVSASAQTTVDSVDQTYLYIRSTLDTFRNTGRLVNNPGIDGADLEEFVRILTEFEIQFSAEFSANSAMCSFYLDPENSRMTIEERAGIAFSFLSKLDVRLSRYVEATQEFEETISEEFGRLVLESINEIKLNASSHQRLPSSSLDEAAVIAFLDSACV